MSIVGARLDGIDVTFIQKDWGLALRDVHAIGGLAFKGKTFTWEVTDAEFRSGGRLRILEEKAGIVLPFERGRIDRVATDAEDPDNIHLTASGIATGASRTSGKGVFTGIYGITPASKHSGIDLDVRIENAANAVNAIAANRGLASSVHVGGTGADVHLHLSQPFDCISTRRPGARVRHQRVRVSTPATSAFHVAAEPQAGRVRVDHLSLASPEGGRMEADATFDGLRIDATVTCSRFAAARAASRRAAPLRGRALDGMLHVRADLRVGEAELVRSTLVLTRREGETGPPAVALLAGPSTHVPPGASVVRLSGAKLSKGVLHVPRVAIGMWGGTFGAEGRIALWDMDERNWLSPPRLDLTLLGTRHPDRTPDRRQQPGDRRAHVPRARARAHQ